jgi:heptosyltransferase-2
MARGVDLVIETAKTAEAERYARGEIRKARIDEAIILPNSFRSAWIVWRSGIRSIRGTAGDFRSFMISDTVSLEGLEGAHQSIEYARIFGVDEEALPPPSVAIDISCLPANPISGLDVSSYIAVLPGAARGPSKRYPASHFVAALSSVLGERTDLSVLVCGTPSEAAECAEVADGLISAFPGHAENLCGRTDLATLCATLARARAVCCNDSGGMHLATALGTPVVAVFGLTDPRKTGPLGRAAVVAAEGVEASRAIARESAAAERALASIAPSRVATALKEMLAS